MIELVLFDAVGTLFRPRGSVGDVYATDASEQGLIRDPARWGAEFRAAFHAMPRMAFPGESAERIVALERAWWRELVGRVLDALAAPPGFDRERYFSTLFERFAGAGAWQLYDDVLPTLETLAARGVTSGIVSNFDGRCRRVCAALGIVRFMASFTLASEAGVAKPDPAIFAVALAKHGVRPRRAIHVGDHPIEDAIASRALGVKALLLDRRKRPTGPGGVTRIGSLSELIPHLDEAAR